MTMRVLARSVAGMFPKALGQIVTSVVAGICIAVATNWLLRTETPPAPTQPVFVVERVAPLPETGIRRPEMPLFLSVAALPPPTVDAAPAAPAHPRAEVEALARLPQAQLPDMRRNAVEVAPLPPLSAEPLAPAPVHAAAAPSPRAQDPGFLGRHLPAAQRGLDLVQGETAAIISAVTSTLPLGVPDDRGGGDTATSELY
jgi:hypothetical protein